MSKRLGGIIGCKYKTSSWHLNGFPYSNIGSTVYNIGEKPTVILYTYINRHAGTPEKQRNQKHCSTSSNMVVIIYCYIGCEDKATTWFAICKRPDSHTRLFLFFWRCRFFRVFFLPFPLFLCMESTSYVISFRMMFFYLVTTGWIFYISLFI